MLVGELVAATTRAVKFLDGLWVADSGELFLLEDA